MYSEETSDNVYSQEASNFKVELPEGVPPFIHVYQNDFIGRKHKKAKEEDIAICECKYDANDPESACGERCLNVLTNTECTPGCCPCGVYCKNQRFQKCEYVKTKMFKTDGRGWGLLADEDIKAGRFIIEYCGEVISLEKAKQRSRAYEAQGLKDAYIISLNANYYIDATRKGSLARFINHSCQPNCETRKWTVLGETRVGIFAKQDISIGTELAYDYNFEWYGGANVRCLCGAANCSLFLGARSHGFQEYNHVWVDDDDRYAVEKIPLYDSAEDEALQELPGTGSPYPVPVEGMAVDNEKTEMEEGSYRSGTRINFGQTDDMLSSMHSNSDDMLSSIRSNSDDVLSSTRSISFSGSYSVGQGSSARKKPLNTRKRKPKVPGKKQLDAKNVAQLFASREAREEIIECEEKRNQAASRLNSVYDEIRPAIEEHERDDQDNVPISVAEKWIDATCTKMMADFDFHFSVVKNVICPKPADQPRPSEAVEPCADK